MLTKAVAEALERNVKLSLSRDAAIVNASKAADMEEAAQVSSLEGYREYAYFVFVFIAFYGYLMGVVVYYFWCQRGSTSSYPSNETGIFQWWG